MCVSIILYYSRSFSMQFVSKYNLQKNAVLISLTALSVIGCQKEQFDITPDNNKVPTAEFWYTVDLNFYRPSTPEILIPASAFVDTVAQISTNDSIKKIHILSLKKTFMMERIASSFER